MVGGYIIQITSKGNGVTQLWCVETKNVGATELAVDVKDAPAMPLVGDEVWWQAGKVYWDRDRRELEKVGYSYDPCIPSTLPRDGVE